MVPQNCVKIFVCWISTDIKKIGTLAYAMQKIEFWGVHLGGVPGRGGIHKLCQNICLLNINWYQKKMAH